MRGFTIAVFIISTCVVTHAESTKSDADGLCEAALRAEGMCALNRAFAGLWLARDLPQANADLRSAYAEILADAKKLTPEIADENAKWQMRTWVRLYYLFGHDEARFPDRVSPTLIADVRELLWAYANAKSTVARADPDLV
jgi:hypothetical protein